MGETMLRYMIVLVVVEYFAVLLGYWIAEGILRNGRERRAKRRLQGRKKGGRGK